MIFFLLITIVFCQQLLIVNGPYVFTDKATLVTAVNAWIADETAATVTYGVMNTWDVSRVTDMSQLFKDKATFNSDISSWDVSGVTNMNSMFSRANSFNSDVSGWDVSNVTNMGSVFYYCIQQRCK